MMQTETVQYSLRRARRAFTLLEILIVGALIALFAGLAAFSAQTMYDSNRGKAMFAEAYSIGTALSIAHDDLGFYPKLHALPMPSTLVDFRNGQVYPGIDSCGFWGFDTPQAVTAVTQNWRGPYIGMSESRTRQAQGATGIGRVRLSDVSALTYTLPDGQPANIVDWPTDTWGRPWVFYQVTSDPAFITGSNPHGVRFVISTGEQANYFNAVVSYGSNGLPGGLPRDSGSEPPTNTADLESAALFLPVLPGSTDGRGAEFAYTTKSAFPFDETFGLARDVDALARSLNNPDLVNNPRDVGILDPGSDDIIFRF